MAVEIVFPHGAPAGSLQPGQYAVVECDAPDNPSAIFEVDEWCREHGYERTGESWLGARTRQDGRRVYRARCYRPYPEEDQALRADMSEFEARVREMQETPPTADLRRMGG